MEITITVIVASLSCIIATMSFVKNGTASVKRQAEEWGEIKGDIRRIKEDMAEIKGTLVQMEDLHAQRLDRVCRRIDERIAEHEKTYHDGGR